MGNALSHVSPGERPRVQVFPSATGTTLVVGVTELGEWVAEFRCYTADLTSDMLEALEQRVKNREFRPHLVD